MAPIKSPKIGTHDYSGACAPETTSSGRSKTHGFETFSVGIFEWLEKSRGGVKKGKVKVRVSGPTSEPEKVYTCAKAICVALDKGAYDGPKSVRVPGSS